MHDILPLPFQANFSGPSLALAHTQLVLPLCARDLVDLYRSISSPDFEIGGIPVYLFILVCKFKGLRLTSVVQNRFIALEKHEQYTFCEGLKLEGIMKELGAL